MANFSDLFGYSGTTNVRGVVPVGGVIPILSTVGFTPPATGEVKDGWMLCDGGTVPINHVLAGETLPILNDGRFLMGASSLAGAGGNTNNEVTLDIPHLPSHTHSTPNHTHPVPAHTHTVGTSTATWNSANITTTADSHSHNLHVVGTGTYQNYLTGNAIGNTGNGGSNYFDADSHSHTFNKNLLNTNQIAHGHSVTGGATTTGDDSGTAHTHTVQNHTHTNDFAVSEESLHTHGVTGVTVSDEIAHVHGAGTLSAGSGSAPSSTDNRPKYVSCIYMIRVD